MTKAQQLLVLNFIHLSYVFLIAFIICNDPSHFRPISLLSVTYKLFERLFLNRLSPLIDESIPKEQSSFRPNRECQEQVSALTNFIENDFQKSLKTIIVMVDLSAAYDTIWSKGLIVKFLKKIPSRRIGLLMNDMLSNRMFKVYVNVLTSRWKR